jgi:hypothetical protein
MKSDISDLASDIAYELSRTAYDYQVSIEALTRNYLNELGMLAWKRDKEVTAYPIDYLSIAEKKKLNISTSAPCYRMDGKIYKVIRKITPTVDTDMVMLGYKAESFLREFAYVIQDLREKCEDIPHFAPHLTFKIEGFMCSASLSCGVFEEIEVKNDAPVS